MDRDIIKQSCFADLPEEIGRVIFQFVAGSDREAGLSCALVSQKVNTWVEPILFREVAIMNGSQLSNLCDRVIMAGSKSRKPQDFLALHVKSLVLVVVWPGVQEIADAALENTLIVLKACSKVNRLALPGYGFGYRASESATQALREFVAGDGLSPRQLFIGVALFPRDHRHFHCSIFQNVTHLELPCLSPSNRWDWDGLRHLTGLTHLSTFFYSPPMELDWVLETVAMFPPHLRVFILWTDELDLPRDDTELICDGGVDPRVVLGVMGGGMNSSMTVPHTVFLDHENFTYRKYLSQNDHPDFWTLAEGIIHERLQKNSADDKATLAST